MILFFILILLILIILLGFSLSLLLFLLDFALLLPILDLLTLVFGLQLHTGPLQVYQVGLGLKEQLVGVVEHALHLHDVADLQPRLQDLLVDVLDLELLVHVQFALDLALDPLVEVLPDLVQQLTHARQIRLEPLVFQHLLRIRPFLRVQRQHPVDQILRLRRHLLPDRVAHVVLAVGDLADQVRHIRVVKRHLATQHHVQHGACRPHVHLLVVVTQQEYLRRRERECACLRQHPEVVACALSRHVEVGDEHLLVLRDQDVGRLDVAVTHAVLVQIRNAFHHLSEYVLRLFLPVVAQERYLVEYLLPVHILHHLLHLLLDVVDEDLDRFDHVLVVDALSYAELALMHQDLLLVLLSHNLHRVWRRVLGVALLETFVHCRVHALTQLHVQVVKSIKGDLLGLGETCFELNGALLDHLLPVDSAHFLTVYLEFSYHNN